MPNFFNKYPYTDFHELNLDWVLETIKQLVADWEEYHTSLTGEWNDMQEDWHDVEEAWISLKNYVENYFATLNVQDEVNHKLDQMALDGTLDSLLLPYFNAYKEDINAIILNQNSRITTLEGRMDTFASLTEGSTTGDAELMDIRVGANGITYPTAGDAVRGQYTDLDDHINEDVYNISKILDIDDPLEFKFIYQQGSLSNTGEERSGSNRIRTRFLYIGNLKSITASIEAGYRFSISLYAADMSYKSETGWKTVDTTIEKGDTSGKAIFVRFVISKTDNTDLLPTDSIDFTVTGISQINSEFDKCDKFNFVDLNNEDYWMYGTRTNTGVIVPNNTRITCQFFNITEGDRIFTTYDTSYVGTVYSVDVMYFDRNFNFIEKTSWQVQNITATHTGYATILMRKKDNSIIDSDDFSDMIANFYYRPAVTNLGKQFSDITVRKAINHSGWGAAPENTIVAYQESYNEGFRYVETDIRFTSDDVAVLLHDATINRTGRNPDGTAISDPTYIQNITYAQSQYYDFGIYKGAEYAGTKLPTLEEFFELCKGLNLCPYLDMTGSKAEILKIAELTDQNGMMGSATFLCAKIEYAEWISSAYPAARIGLVGDIDGSIMRLNAASIPTGLNDVFILTNIEKVESAPEYIETFRDMGFPIEVWNITSTTQLDNMHEYISGIEADTINAEVYYLNKYRLS